MCGVPVERADDYLNRLIALGHRVAVCEQLEDPAEAKKRGAKSVVRRDVVRLVTPGHDHRGAAARAGPGPPSPRRAEASCKRRRSMPTALPRSIFRPAHSRCRKPTRRVLRRKSRGSSRARSSPLRRSIDERLFSQIVGALRVTVTPLARAAGDGPAAERSICEFYGVETLDGFGAFTRAEIAAAALALAYVKRTQFEARPALSPPTRRARGTSLEIDPATRANLEADPDLSAARARARSWRRSTLTVTPGGGAPDRRTARKPADRPRGINRAARFARLPGRSRAAARGPAPGARACARLSQGAFASQP